MAGRGRNILLRLVADPSGAKRGLSETETAVKRFGNLKAEARADIKTDAAKAKLDTLYGRLRRLGSQEQSPEIKIRTANTLKQIERVEHELDNVGRKTGRASGALTGAFGKAGAIASAVGVTYGLSAAVRSVTTETVGFDRAMRNVNSIAQLSEKDLTALAAAVRDLAGRTAQAPQTLAEGLYDLVSSGFDAKQSLLILRSSAKAATAGLTDTATSTKAVAAVLNAYHRPAKDAAAVSDTLFQTVNLGVISFEQLASTIGDVLPFASSLGVSLNEVGAATSTLTKAGISPEETMTRIKNVMVAMLKPSDELQHAFDKLGAASGEALIKQKGFQGALEAVVGTTDGTKAAVAQLFPNIRGLGGALALTGKNALGAEKDLRGFAHTGGATDKALSQQAKSISYQWNKAKAEFSEVAIELGTVFLPAVIAVLHGVSQFIETIRGSTVAVTILRRVVGAIGDYFATFTDTARAFIRTIRGLLHGDFREIFGGLRDIVISGLNKVSLGMAGKGVALMRRAGEKLGRALAAGVSSAFKSVIGFVEDRVNNLIDAFNALPGPDIGHVGVHKVNNSAADALGNFGSKIGQKAHPGGGGSRRPTPGDKQARISSLASGAVFVDKLVMPQVARPIGNERYDAVKLHRALRRLGTSLPA